MTPTPDTQFADRLPVKLVEALCDPRFVWRTPSGLSAQTGIGRDDVLIHLNRATGRIVRCRFDASTGEPLFSFRDHLLNNSSFGEQLAGAFMNRIHPLAR